MNNLIKTAEAKITFQLQVVRVICYYKCMIRLATVALRDILINDPQR